MCVFLKQIMVELIQIIFWNKILADDADGGGVGGYDNEEITKTLVKLFFMADCHDLFQVVCPQDH